MMAGQAMSKLALDNDISRHVAELNIKGSCTSCQFWVETESALFKVYSVSVISEKYTSIVLTVSIFCVPIGF